MTDRPIRYGKYWCRDLKYDCGLHSLSLSLFISLLIVCSGCHKSPKKLSDADSGCLTALALYNPTHKLNAEGRVIELRLEGKHVDDRALDEVMKLSELQVLSLYGASVTDTGLVKLNGLVHLEKLGLGATHLTDRGLPYLEKMPSLRHVWLTDNGHITDQGVQRLKERGLPGLKVYH